MNDSRTKIGCGLLPVILAFWFVSNACWGAENGNTENRFEPTVNRDEAEWLTAAQNMAETNTTAAIGFLAEKTGPEASAALDFALGNFRFQNEQLEAAAEAYQNALQKLPLFKKAIGNLGRVFLIQEKPEKTIGLYRKLVENGQATAELYSLLGQAHLLLENYVSAENAFRQTILLAPDEQNAKMGLAKCLLQQDRFKESRALASELLEADPKNSELWSLRANIALAMQDQSAALTSVESARRLGKASAQMLATLGDIYVNRNQPKEAVAAYRQSFQKEEPSFKRIVSTTQALLSLGATREADKMLNTAEKLKSRKLHDEKNLKLLELRAAIAKQRGNNEEAMQTYRRILDLAPLNGDALLGLAELEWERGKLEDAIISSERAARIDGFEAEALVLQAQIEVEREDYAKAVDLLERAQAFEEQEHVQRYLDQIRKLAENR